MHGSVEEVLSGEAQFAIVHADNRVAIKAIPDESIDFVAADPCYAIGPRDPTPEEILAFLHGAELDTKGDFMSKASWSLPTVALWREHFRVLKPGAHLAVFCGPQTADLMSMAIRLAGFERRDDVPIYGSAAWNWIQGQGMKKGLDVSKAIDEAAGAEREVVGRYMPPDGKERSAAPRNLNTHGDRDEQVWNAPTLAPSSPEAQRWDGWETDLSPRHEEILLFRKPLDFASHIAMIGECLSTLIASLAVSISGCHLPCGDTATEGTAPWHVATQPGEERAQRTSTSTTAGSSATGATSTYISETECAFWSTVTSWRSTLEDLCSMEKSFTTEMVSSLTIDLRTLSSLIHQLTQGCTGKAEISNAGLDALASSVGALFGVVRSRLSAIRILSAHAHAGNRTAGGICKPENAQPSHESILIFRKPIATVTSEQLRAATGWSHWHVVTDFRKPEARANACAKWGVEDSGGDLQERDVRALDPEAESWRELRWREKGGAWVVLKSTEPAAYKTWKICNVAANVLVYGTGAISIDRCRTYTDWSDRPDSWKRSGHSAKQDAEKIASPPGTGINCHPGGRHPGNCFFLHDRRCERAGERKVQTGTAVERNVGGAAKDNAVYGSMTHNGIDHGYASADGTEKVPAYSCLVGCRSCGREWTAPSGGKAPACECGVPGQWRCAVARLDAQAGIRKSGARKPGVRKGMGYQGADGDGGPAINASEGSVSRFFPTFDWAEEPEPYCYTSKAPRAERDAGLDHRNTHVAVKPQKVLEYLVRLVGAPGAVGLTAWAGSGSEVAAMVSQGCRAIGIEWDAVHHADAMQRVPALVRGERRRAPDPKREPPKPAPVKAQPMPAVQQLSFL